MYVCIVYTYIYQCNICFIYKKHKECSKILILENCSNGYFYDMIIVWFVDRSRLVRWWRPWERLQMSFFQSILRLARHVIQPALASARLAPWHENRPGLSVCVCVYRSRSVAVLCSLSLSWFRGCVRSQNAVNYCSTAAFICIYSASIYVAIFAFKCKNVCCKLWDLNKTDMLFHILIWKYFKT